MEKMVVNRLSWYLEKNNLLNPNQAGFRKGHSTSDPIIRLKSEAEFSLNSGFITVAVLIDFTRAFDLLWVDGLLIKMRQLNLSGNIINWVKNFLTNRTNIVKVGNCFSDSFSNENGTPQGSSISPILFLIMVNDFPKLSTFTSDAFFADDCTIWRSGKNINIILYHLQKDLDIISLWCKKWGLVINSDKTIGIVFTRKVIACQKLKLNIQGKPIVFQNSCILLGVQFDNHLTWGPQVESLILKSSKILNIMRCISGINWGASNNILLTIYKSMILSHLDYCCFIYEGCSKTILHKIDTIQYKALLIVTGGMKGTAHNALLGECCEIPLELRREKLLIKYLLKIKNNDNNSAALILKDKKYFNLELNYNSKYKLQLETFFKQTGLAVPDGNTLTIFNPTPWSSLYNQVDLTHLNARNFSDSPIYDAPYVNSIINNISTIFNYTFFVDASVSSEGKVGAALFLPSKKLTIKTRLPNGLSVYFAEATAILLALKYAEENKLYNFCVISDSLHVLQDIKNCNLASSPHPSTIANITKLLSLDTSHQNSLIWLPGHANHPFLKSINFSAKSAAQEITPPGFNITNQEILLGVDAWAQGKWAQNWKLSPTCSYQKMANLRKSCFYFTKSRKKETIINRLRLMQTKLKGGLAKIGLEQEANCSTCGVLQNGPHLILECKETEQLRVLLRANKPSNIKWEFFELLSDTKLATIVADYVLEHNISI